MKTQILHEIFISQFSRGISDMIINILYINNKMKVREKV